MAAFCGLRELRRPDALETAVRVLDDPAASVRRAAVATLGFSPDAQAVTAAMTALGEIGEPAEGR